MHKTLPYNLPFLLVAALTVCWTLTVSADDGDKSPNSAPVADGDQDDEPDMQRDEPADAADLAQRWLNRVRNLGRRNANEKSHENILAAFLEISMPASSSTALVFSGDEPAALGTVVSKDGYILTKASELDQDISCRLRDGRHLPAKIIGVHADNDLAMLKIEAGDLTPVTWNESDPPAVGSWLITTGIEDQPLAIGVASVAARRIRGTPGVLGVSLEDGDGGAKIAEVMKKSAAEKAGVKDNDVVLSVNGKETKGREDLVNNIRKHKPGDTVKLKIRRGEEELELSATLGSSFPRPNGRGDFQNQLGGHLSERRAGFAQAIQHDTVLEPHECGGPVIDLDGKAVGINIARAGRVNSYALPTSVVLAVLDDLKSGKLAPKAPSPNIERITELDRVIQKMTKDLNAQNARRADAAKTLSEVEKSIADLEKSLAAAKAAREVAQQKADAAQAAIDEMKTKLDKLQAERDELETP